jgi:hypothetical protein
MPTVTRRTFLAGAAASVAAARLHAQNSAHASLALPAQASGPQMPRDFIGLSYEVQQLTDPAFFSAANTGLIRQFQAVSANGVLRLGGNTSEYGWWKPTPTTPQPQHPSTRVVTGEPQPLYYPVRRSCPQSKRVSPRHGLEMHLRPQSRHQHAPARRRRSRLRGEDLGPAPRILPGRQ